MLTRIDKVIIAIILTAALLSLPLAISATSDTNAKKVLIYRAGKKTASYDISREKEIKIKGSSGGFCLLRIRKGIVYVAESTCPLKLCQKQGRIERAGQSIICAPMRLMFRIESKNSHSLDAVNE